MTDQRDYGSSGDAALVPGSLTAYRHFAMVSATGRLAPMNNTASWVYASERDQPFQARCTKRERSRYPGQWIGYSSVSGHKSPDVNCTCGFYAHYSPEMDFYSTAKWTDGRGGGSASYWSPFGQDSPGVMLRAVVELSGTIVMGSRGVRAQALTIKALCVDWAKYRASGPSIHFEWDSEFEFDQRALSVERFEGYQRSIRQKYEGQCQAAARRFGADYFTNPEDMYAAYPQPDLSHLDIPEPKEVEACGMQLALYRQGMLAPVIQDIGRVIDAASKAFANMSGVTSLPPEPTPTQPPELTAFQRAILNKKNRSAPPGSGIDRRKRKL